MTYLRNNLEALEEHLARLGVPATSMLNVGLPVESIQRTLGQFSHPSALELFGWHNGQTLPPTKTLGDAYVVPGYHLLRLEDAIEAAQTAAEVDERWGPEMLPFLGNDGGDFYALDLASGSVVSAMHDFDFAEEAESLERWLDAVLECFAEGLYHVDEKGILNAQWAEAEKVFAGLGVRRK